METLLQRRHTRAGHAAGKRSEQSELHLSWRRMVRNCRLARLRATGWFFWIPHASVQRGEGLRPYPSDNLVVGMEAYVSGKLPHLPPKPSDVPAVPHACFRGQGWISYPDF